MTVPADFTRVTGEAHWEVLLRARAIENQAFVVAPDQVGTAPARGESYGGSLIVDPWGEVLARAGDEASASSPPSSTSRARTRCARSCPAWPTACRRLPLARGGARLMAAAAEAGAVDKRRLILDAAIRVFATRGFHHCRVSDVADEAGVAYGLVYHYFDSKEEILNTLFLERWQIMLDAIAEIDAREVAARDKLYGGRRLHHRLLPPRARPDEGDHRRGHARRELVRRAAPGQDPRGLRGHRRHRRVGARGEGSFKSGIPSEFAAMCFYGAIEQLLTGWIFEVLPRTDEEFERPRGSWSRPSAAGWRPAQTALRPVC